MSENQECWATFHGRGGYSYQNKEAHWLLDVGGKYRIIGGEIGRCSTSLILEGHAGFWNSVMFDFDHDSAPLEKTYLGVSRDLIAIATKSYPAEMDGNTYYQEESPVETGFKKFLAYAKSKEWNVDFVESLGQDSVIFLNRAVQGSWELWQEARKA